MNSQIPAHTKVNITPPNNSNLKPTPISNEQQQHQQLDSVQQKVLSEVNEKKKRLQEELQKKNNNKPRSNVPTNHQKPSTIKSETLNILVEVK